MRFNLAGLIPYIAVPVGLVIGIIVSFVVYPTVDSWGYPQRYVPVLLGSGLGVLIGFFIRCGIIGEYYLDDMPERDQENLERILEKLRSGKSGRTKKKGRRRINR